MIVADQPIAARSNLFSQESGADSNAIWGNPATTAFSGAARIRVTVLLGGILDLGICLTSD
jgi:hypothetical protein